MHKSVFLLAAAMAAGVVALPASAATRVLDFTQGNYCRGGQLCTNNGSIDQSYGDTAEVDMNYTSLRDGGRTQGFYYERGFGDLNGVLFAGNGDPSAQGQVFFTAQDGYELSLASFDVGCFGGSASCRTASYTVFGDNTQVAAGLVGTNYPSHATVTPNTDYFRQIVLTFGSGENVGLDNIRFDARQLTDLPSVSAVPEPASWAMMISGFGIMGGAMRRRGATSRTRAGGRSRSATQLRPAALPA